MIGLDPYIDFGAELVTAWQKGTQQLRRVLLAAIASVTAGAHAIATSVMSTPQKRRRFCFDRDLQDVARQLPHEAGHRPPRPSPQQIGGVTVQRRDILVHYRAYYHGNSTHLSLAKDTPERRTVQPPELGRVVAIPHLGGLHHRYERRAA